MNPEYGSLAFSNVIGFRAPVASADRGFMFLDRGTLHLRNDEFGPAIITLPRGHDGDELQPSMVVRIPLTSVSEAKKRRVKSTGSSGAVLEKGEVIVLLNSFVDSTRGAERFTFLFSIPDYKTFRRKFERSMNSL